MEDLKATNRSGNIRVEDRGKKTGLIKTRFKGRYLDIDFKVLVHVLSIGGRHLYNYFMKLIRM